MIIKNEKSLALAIAPSIRAMGGENREIKDGVNLLKGIKNRPSFGSNWSSFLEKNKVTQMLEEYYLSREW